jgi:hypothetical protein
LHKTEFKDDSVVISTSKLLGEVASGIKLSAINAAAKVFNDSTNTSSKTPVSLLQEICSKNQTAPPVYELMSAEGQMHQPLFVYKCSLGTDYSAVGKGSSKKKAKHASALAVLNLIKEKNVGVNDNLANQLGILM